jgi:predicted ATP-dependent endonuclease of OLD family
MRLITIEIEGYRSINQKVTIACDPQVTVVLGANDHGKSNLLSAIKHLNADEAFELERDLNWDCSAKADILPHIVFELALDAHDQSAVQSQLLKVVREKFISQHLATAEETLDLLYTTSLDTPQILNAILDVIQASYVRSGGSLEGALTKGLAETIEKATAAEQFRAAALNKYEAANVEWEKAKAAGDAAVMNIAKTALTSAGEEKAKAEKEVERASFKGHLLAAANVVKSGTYKSKLKAELEIIPKTITLNTIKVERRGTQGELHVILPEDVEDSKVEAVLLSRLPRIELIGPVDRLADSVDREQISETDFEFMRGVFYYAGLTKDSWDSIFEQNDRTARQLEAASQRLNETLQKSWSQGRELGFKLQHSSGSKIELYISDPVVRDRYVRASRRSTGFTHFFTLKTILHSRQTESPARSYIWLFDEPGLYLHPNGQHDLLQVLETLATSNQIIYSTHSLFMINKNYPVRHRLVLKEGAGTRIDGKPYIGQWRAAIDSLGLALPGTILFATKVLLVEGDSDPIFLHAILLKLIELGVLKADLNSLAIISTGESKNADALIRILMDAAIKPQIAAIFDGDDGGRARQKSLAALLKSHSIPNFCLKKNTTIEDYLLAAEKIFVPAVARYAAKVSGANEDEILSALKGSYKDRFKDTEAESIAGLAAWSRSAARDAAHLESEPSSVGVAREYALALLDVLPADLRRIGVERPTELSEWIIDKLNLPNRILAQQAIFEAKA